MRDVTKDGTIIAARVPIELARAFSEIAEREERSVSAELRRVMRQHVTDKSTRRAGRADDDTAMQAPGHGEG